MSVSTTDQEPHVRMSEVSEGLRDIVMESVYMETGNNSTYLSHV